MFFPTKLRSSGNSSLKRASYRPSGVSGTYLTSVFPLPFPDLLLSPQVKVTVFLPWQTQLWTTWITTLCFCATLSRPSLLIASRPTMAHPRGLLPSTPITAVPDRDSPTSGAAAVQEVKIFCVPTTPTIRRTPLPQGFLGSRLSCKKWKMTMGKRRC